MRMTFFLDCVPTAQQRARHTRLGRAYKSKEQEANERTLEALLMPHKPENALSGPVSLFFIASMPIPASTGKRALELILGGKNAHTKKPDVDNLGKQLLDCMTRLRFWADDKQVWQLSGKKIYAATPGWHITLETDD